MRFVLDASVTLSWFLKDAASRDEAYSFAVMSCFRVKESVAIVPVTWGLEVANVIARCESKRQVTETQSESFLTLLKDLAIEVDGDTFPQSLTDTLQLARRYRLSSYDASYLELAVREALPLATLDADLRRAAVKAGVKLFKP